LDILKHGVAQPATSETMLKSRKSEIETEEVNFALMPTTTVLIIK
jgi:hypothetical protein